MGADAVSCCLKAFAGTPAVLRRAGAGLRAT
jgi:hypothetical protein